MEIHKSDDLPNYHPERYAGRLSSQSVRPEFDIEKSIGEDPERRKLYDTAHDFQALLTDLMLQSMRSTLDKESDMLYGGQSQEMFEDMLYKEYGKILSKNSGFGLADQIYIQNYEQVSSNPQHGESIRRNYEENLNRSGGAASTSDIQTGLEWLP